MKFANIVWNALPSLRVLSGSEAYDQAARAAFEVGGDFDRAATKADKGAFIKSWRRLRGAA